MSTTSVGSAAWYPSGGGECDRCGARWTRDYPEEFTATPSGNICERCITTMRQGELADLRAGLVDYRSASYVHQASGLIGGPFASAGAAVGAGFARAFGQRLQTADMARGLAAIGRIGSRALTPELVPLPPVSVAAKAVARRDALRWIAGALDGLPFYRFLWRDALLRERARLEVLTVREGRRRGGGTILG